MRLAAKRCMRSAPKARFRDRVLVAGPTIWPHGKAVPLAAAGSAGALAGGRSPPWDYFFSDASYSSMIFLCASAYLARMSQKRGLRLSMKALPPSLPSGVSNQSG